MKSYVFIFLKSPCIQLFNKEVLMKLIFLTLVLFFLLSGCNAEEEYTYWTEKTDNQIQLLDEAIINYEIREGEIWIRDRDFSRILICCS